MKKTWSFLLAVGIVLALAFTLSDPSKVGGGTLEWRLEECRDE